MKFFFFALGFFYLNGVENAFSQPESLDPAMVWVSKRRIRPGEEIHLNDFFLKKRDPRLSLAGAPFVDFPAAVEAGKKFEATQTILEGSILSSYSIRRVYDVRRGDSVKVKIFSNGVILTTRGKVEHPAYINDFVKISTGDKKKELSGVLREDRLIEVTL